MTHEPFICPQCRGEHFGSASERRPDGSIWKIAEECHDQHEIGCNWVRRCEVLILQNTVIDTKTQGQKLLFGDE